MLPVSRKTYYFDLDQANETGTPDWKLMTDWTADFDLTDLSPGSMKKHADKMSSDETFSADFLNRSKRITDGHSTCSESCRKEVVCSARYIDTYAYATCMGDSIYDWTGDFMGSFRQAMLEPWYHLASSASQASRF